MTARTDTIAFPAARRGVIMGEEKNYVVVTVSGRDRPGITAAFARILIDHGVEIADIDQATLQDFLALTLLLELNGGDAEKDSVLKDLLFEANRLDMVLNFQLLSERELRLRKEKNLFVLTFFGGTRALAEIAHTLADATANIEKISNLARGGSDCIELTINVRQVGSLSELKEQIMTVSHGLGVDVAFQKLEAYRKGKRLIFFDMDDTLVDGEIIDEIARAAGVYREVSRVTEKAMRGEVDFEDALRQRVALLKGLPIKELERIRDEMRISEGADRLVDTLRKLGYRMGVVSGGFRFFADYLAETLGLDFAYANVLETKDGVLTGRLTGEVIDGAGKARIVNTVADEMGIMLDQTVAIGDGINDSLMLGQAGLGIAYNAKEGLAQVASAKLGRTRLINILRILGITEDDISPT
ncbi:MAG: phosphoserine phosphatase SerB [Candidatus Krumholzibacteriota bacterium]|nr:phosphoserine phosphatase SerB [Candidatus Krumholzibacteriota bacterium]